MSKRRTIGLVVGSGVLGLLFGMGVASAGSRSEAAVTPVASAPVTVVETVTVASPPETVTVASPPETVYVEVPPPPPPGPAQSFGDGTWEVGVDVAPGKYKTSGGDQCYYALLSGTGGGLDDIIENQLGAGPRTVTIEDGTYFESQRCGTWSRS